MLHDSSLPFDFSDFFCFAENMCLVDGKQPIAVPIIAEDQELVHLNRLRCHLFFRLHLQPCHRQCHLTSADSPHIQHEATILHELHSMTPDAFQTELCASSPHSKRASSKFPARADVPKPRSSNAGSSAAEPPPAEPPSVEDAPAVVAGVGSGEPIPAVGGVGEADAAEAAPPAKTSRGRVGAGTSKAVK